MTETEFVGAVAEILHADASTLTPQTPLESLEGYDSLGKISLIALVDEQFNFMLAPSKLRQLKTIADVFGVASKNG
jgi:acyl carrier protein